MSQKNKTKEHLFKLEAAKGQKRKNTQKKNYILGVSWASRRVSGHPGRSASSPMGQQQDRAKEQPKYQPSRT
jgi:hypothetical protein